MNRITMLKSIHANFKDHNTPVITIKPGRGLIHFMQKELSKTHSVTVIDCTTIIDEHALTTTIQRIIDKNQQPSIIILDMLDRLPLHLSLKGFDICANRKDIPNDVYFIITVAQAPTVDEQVFDVYPEIQMLNASDVETTFEECLSNNKNNTDNIVEIQAITHTFSFDKTALERNKSKLKDMLCELPEEFMETGGGGYSFLQACMTRFNEQWTGMHFTMEKLFAMGMATDLAKCLLPRSLWAALPGNVPYYVVKA